MYELPLLPVGRVLIPFHGSGKTCKSNSSMAYGREWAWLGLPRETVAAVRAHLAARGVVFDDSEEAEVKGGQVRTYHDKWWTLFQARFAECKIVDVSGAARAASCGVQFVLAQAKADLFAAVAFEVRLTYGGRVREYGEWKRTPMHLHFSPRLICITGKSEGGWRTHPPDWWLTSF